MLRQQGLHMHSDEAPSIVTYYRASDSLVGVQRQYMPNA